MRRAALACLLLWGCSSSAPSGSATPSSNPSATTPDGGPASPDAGVEPEDLVPLEKKCLGISAPLVLSGKLPFIDVKVDGKKGAFLVDFASTGSAIDLEAFDTPPVSSDCDPTKLGQSCTFQTFDFFGAWGKVYLYTSLLVAPDDTVRQAGVIGTDLTRLVAMSLDYADGRAYRAGSGELCSDDQLRAAGLVALSSEGFFAYNLATLKLNSTVDATSTGNVSVPNVPTVPVMIAGVAALAQLDTGFSDKVVPFSVNVNEAMFDAIVAKDPSSLVRDEARDQSLSTCAGVTEAVEAYKLSSAATLDMIDDTDGVARRWTKATLFVKRTPKAALKCGGIGTWTVPAAQMAASFFVDSGLLVFDPFTSRVWVKKS